MKKLLLVALLLSLVGCTEKTPYGKCIGIGDDKDPKKVYKVDSTNLILGIVFVETIFVPVIVALDEFYCPYGDKK
jgi:hypothetical protein